MFQLLAVSVVIPTVRRPRRLWRALESVATQTYPNVEVVVVNDGGIPVPELIERYKTTFGRTAEYLHLDSNRGLAAARNAAISMADGELIALLDDDDRYLPDHIERLVETLRRHQSAVLAYDDVLIVVESGSEDDAESHIIATCRLGLPYDKARFDTDDFIVPSAMLIRRASLELVGGFNEALPICEDWDLLLRMREHGDLMYDGGGLGVYYSMRAEAGDNLGSTFDDRRRAALDYLSTRYSLPPLQPKTFLDVARDLGFPVMSVTSDQ
jgi:glycosyltransferase involved in cell wall biosynthesis